MSRVLLPATLIAILLGGAFTVFYFVHTAMSDFKYARAHSPHGSEPRVISATSSTPVRAVRTIDGDSADATQKPTEEADVKPREAGNWVNASGARNGNDQSGGVVGVTALSLPLAKPSVAQLPRIDEGPSPVASAAAQSSDDVSPASNSSADAAPGSVAAYAPSTSGGLFPSLTVPLETATVTARSLNLRDRPDLAAPRIGGLPRGTKLTIHERRDDWVKIVVTGANTSGWVNTDWIALDEPVVASAGQPIQ